MRKNRPNDALHEGRTEAPFSTGLRVALYHRVSTLDQDPTLARTEIGNWVARQGGTVALAIEETGSGARNDRPGLQRILKAAERGEVDAVCVWKLDRWGRSSLDVLANISTLADAGVRFVAVSQGLDVKPHGDAMSRLMLNVLSAVAEFELTLVSERTRLGLERARKAGKKLGRPRSSGPSPEQVRKLRAAGQSWTAIAAQYECNVMLVRRRAAEQR
jgi:DNA invertase Pin-like site-specific DNA recombinase